MCIFSLLQIMLQSYAINSEHIEPENLVKTWLKLIWTIMRLISSRYHSAIKWEAFWISVLALEHAVQVWDVADGEAEDLDLGEFLVRGQGRQESPQSAEGSIEGLMCKSSCHSRYIVKNQHVDKSNLLRYINSQMDMVNIYVD